MLTQRNWDLSLFGYFLPGARNSWRGGNEFNWTVDRRGRKENVLFVRGNPETISPLTVFRISIALTVLASLFFRSSGFFLKCCNYKS